MSDVRYSARVDAAEVMGRVYAVVEVWELQHDPMVKDKRIYRRTFDCDPAGEPGSSRWVRDLLVELAEHL